MQERYQAASMSWQHPENSYQPATLAALRSVKANANLLEQRHTSWRDAFRGLYHALRHRHCDAFYFSTPQVGISASHWANHPPNGRLSFSLGKSPSQWASQLPNWTV